jgi:hypothetical protein
VLSSTVPAHRMRQTFFIDFTFAMLVYTQMRGQVLSSTVPAHRMCQTLLVDFTFCDAGLHPEEGPSALKYPACAQNVSDITHSFYILRCWSTSR